MGTPHIDLGEGQGFLESPECEERGEFEIIEVCEFRSIPDCFGIVLVRGCLVRTPALTELFVPLKGPLPETLSRPFWALKIM